MTPDPLVDKYPSLTPYHYCMNNPLRFIDPAGLEAWEVTSEWDEETINKYHEYAATRAQEYAESGAKASCEDFALNILIDFASANGLDVSITNETGTLSASSDDFDNVSDFRNSVLKSTGARDLQRNENTSSLSVESVKSGDMMLLTSNGTAWHTQLVSSVGSNQINIHQGNNGGSIFNLSSNPQSLLYYGSKIQTGTYTRDKSGVYTYTRGQKTVYDAINVYGVQAKRWNYSKW